MCTTTEDVPPLGVVGKVNDILAYGQMPIYNQFPLCVADLEILRHRAFHVDFSGGWIRIKANAIAFFNQSDRRIECCKREWPQPVRFVENAVVSDVYFVLGVGR